MTNCEGWNKIINFLNFYSIDDFIPDVHLPISINILKGKNTIDYQHYLNVKYSFQDKDNMPNQVNLSEQMKETQSGKVFYELFFQDRILEWKPSKNFIFATSLIIDGKINEGTSFHLDYTDAQNMAFAYGLGQKQPLSTWTFIAIKYVKELNEYFSNFKFHSNYVLTLKQSEELLVYIQSKYENESIDCHIVTQYAGQKMSIPVNYIHQVYNHVNHIKLAYDSVIPSRLPNYVENLKLKQFEAYKWLFNGKDYIRLGWILKSIVYAASVSLSSFNIIF